VIDWVAETAAALNRRLMVRLVKGAYWDTEIKRAQERGLPDYPVFTRKAMTDLCYLDCVRKLLAARSRLYPQFATHNALTVACVIEDAAGSGGFEFQRLHGMGEALYESLLAELPDLTCRVYAPVGGYADLLAYLVRRLLEIPRCRSNPFCGVRKAGSPMPRTRVTHIFRCRATCLPLHGVIRPALNLATAPRSKPCSPKSAPRRKTCVQRR
jgi:hypothetical protein